MIRSKFSSKIAEGSLKYFLVSAIGSGVFLLGILIIFSVSGTVNWDYLCLMKSNNYIYWGTSLILISCFIKLGAAPFHFWLIDVYEANFWVSLIWITLLPKLGVLLIIFRFEWFPQLILFISLLSILIGVFGAFNQTKFKRFLGYSTVTHTGFFLLPLILPYSLGIQVSLFYYSLYSLTIILLLFLLNHLKIKSYIVEIGFLINSNKSLTILLGIVILSLSGFPPLAGFVGKFLVIWQLYNFSYFFICLILILVSILSMGYYMNMFKLLTLEPNEEYLCWKNSLIKSSNILFYHEYLCIFTLLYFTCFLILNLQWILTIFNYFLILY